MRRSPHIAAFLAAWIFHIAWAIWFGGLIVLGAVSAPLPTKLLQWLLGRMRNPNPTNESKRPERLEPLAACRAISAALPIAAMGTRCGLSQ